jgi:hypothetical protein
MGSGAVYRLAVPRWYPAFVFSILGILTVSAVAGIVTAIRGPEQSGPPLVVAIVFAGIGAWNWYVVLTLPYEVRFEGAETIVFRSVVRVTRVRLATVRAIQPALFDAYIIRHDGGAVRLSVLFRDKVGEIVRRIKAANPEL